MLLAQQKLPVDLLDGQLRCDIRDPFRHTIVQGDRAKVEYAEAQIVLSL